jgi:hypothetical protein
MSQPGPGVLFSFYFILPCIMFLHPEFNAFPHPQGPLVCPCHPRSVSHLSHLSHSHPSLSKVSQPHGSPSSHLPPPSAHTGHLSSIASPSPSLRLYSPLVRVYSLIILTHTPLTSNWLGMIWRMTPSRMPHWFCVVQTVVIGLCFHILTGICGCFTWASYLTVFKPYRSIQASAS